MTTRCLTSCSIRFCPTEYNTLHTFHLPVTLWFFKILFSPRGVSPTTLKLSISTNPQRLTPIVYCSFSQIVSFAWILSLARKINFYTVGLEVSYQIPNVSANSAWPRNHWKVSLLTWTKISSGGGRHSLSLYTPYDALS